jgi:hypothetical protein
MSTFSSKNTKSLPIPFDPPHEVLIRQLSGEQLERASAAFLVKLFAGIHDRGGASVQKDVQQLFDKSDDKADEEIKAVQADPLNGLDVYEVMSGGIVGWSYAESLERVKVEEIDRFGNKVTVLRIPALLDLSDEARRFLATEIMRLTKPSLFETKEAAKASQKETEADSSIA